MNMGLIYFISLHEKFSDWLQAAGAVVALPFVPLVHLEEARQFGSIKKKGCSVREDLT